MSSRARYRTIPALKKEVPIDARHALVTGATGVLGPVLVAELLSQGWSVRILRRNSPQQQDRVDFPVEVDVRVGDITDEAAVARAVDGVSTVFHLAGLLHNPRPVASDIPRYEAVNVGGARHVARAAMAAGARVVAFSTIAVYGATREPVDEATPIRPEGPYATTKAKAEDVLLESGVPVRVLRLSAVYGRRMKGNYHRLAEALRRGRFVPVGDGLNRRTLVHENDVVLAALLAAQAQGVPRGVYNVTDGETHTMKAILAAMCEAIGRPEPRFRLPATLARVLARSVGHGHVVEKYLENVEVRGDLIRRDLDFAPRFDLRAGWRHALGVGETK